jgi:antitoxin component YwqK of YwqJK toxin-antitoxin module
MIMRLCGEIAEIQEIQQYGKGLRSKERNPLYFCTMTIKTGIIVFAALTIAWLPCAAQTDTLNRTDSRGMKTGWWISKDDQGKKVYEGFFRNGKPAGRFTRFHATGAVRAEMNYLPDGIRVEARHFDPEGRLRAEGVYAEQLRDGEWVFYSEKKLPVFRIIYLKGRINGTAMRYDANGKLSEQTVWIDNRLSGERVIYYADGKPQARILYRQGLMDGAYELLFPNGVPEVRGLYTAGVKTGKWYYFKPDGNTDYMLSYRDGRLLNPEVLDARQRESFERYEKNKGLLTDPQEFINNPDELLRR